MPLKMLQLLLCLTLGFFVSCTASAASITLPKVVVVKRKEVKTDKTWVSWQNMNQAKYLGLLTGASLLSSVTSHPLHVITMRQQAGAMAVGGKGLLGVVGSLREAVSTLGLKGLFRGWVPLMLETPSHALYFAVTEASREVFQSSLLRLSKPAPAPSTASQTSTISKTRKMHFRLPSLVLSATMIDTLQALLSSLLANTISLVPWVPAEVLSGKLAVQAAAGAVDMNTMVKQVWRDAGWKGFFVGFGSSLIVHIAYSFQWWAAYSISRRELDHYVPSLQASSPILFDAATGLVAGIASCILSHPLDTIKLRTQTASASAFAAGGKPLSFLQQLRIAASGSNGVAGLFSGLSASMVGAAFSSGCFCIAYELIKRTSAAPPPPSTGSPSTKQRSKQQKAASMKEN